MRRSLVLIGAGCITLSCLTVNTGYAQQDSRSEEGGPLLLFGISSTLSATDNYSLRPNGSDSVELLDNRLSFGYQQKRANDALSFDVNGVVRALDTPGANRLFYNPQARLAYDRQGLNSMFSVDAEYQLTSLNSLEAFDSDRFFPDDPPDESDFTQDLGERTQIATLFSFETGLNDPIGFLLNGSYRERSFRNTIDPGLFDTDILDLTGTVRFDLTPVSQARVVLGYQNYSADNATLTDRQTSSISLGFVQALSQVDTLDFSLGFQEINTEETIMGVRSSDTQTGMIGGLALTRELKRGTIGTEVDIRESVNGRTATWMVSRAMSLPRGAFEIAAGVTSDVSDTLLPVGRLDFTHEMPRSTLTAALERRVATSSSANELRITEASLEYLYQINTLSNIEFSANFAEFDQSGGPIVNDISDTYLSAVYNRSLTRDWQLSSGYEYRVRDETGVDTATSNRVFLSIEREFVFRP